MSGTYFDQLETRDAEARETALFALLPGLIDRAKRLAPGWAEHLKGVDAQTIGSREALATVPVLRKSALKDVQAKAPPFGGFATDAAGAMGRIMMSPGPIFEPEGRGENWWRAARALYAAGFRAGDVVHNTFAYHLTPGGWILDSGARALGCAVIPAGPGNTEQQLEAIAHLRPTAYVGVPDYLKILLDKAKEAGKDASSFKRALVSGGALFPSLRTEYKGRGIDVYQCYATADLGVIAYETATASGVVDGMMVEEGVIVEIVKPGTGDPVPAGDVGEVVVTTFNRDYPMIRLATGDMSALIAEQSPCGRTNMRIKGWLGRADQTTKVKGMFVHPEQIAALGKRHPELGRIRLVVGRQGEQDSMTLKAESSVTSDDFKARVAESLVALTKLKGEVVLSAPGSLPNDGKVISDERTYG
ncbi:MAG TPA: AMP-binding protein [Hyphomicrobiaceae bacterium]|nr:AMP-binding protein [Hyphomicrobiaceae bacterium]